MYQIILKFEISYLSGKMISQAGHNSGLSWFVRDNVGIGCNPVEFGPTNRKRRKLLDQWDLSGHVSMANVGTSCNSQLVWLLIVLLLPQLASHHDFNIFFYFQDNVTCSEISITHTARLIYICNMHMTFKLTGHIYFSSTFQKLVWWVMLSNIWKVSEEYNVPSFGYPWRICLQGCYPAGN